MKESSVNSLMSRVDQKPFVLHALVLSASLEPDLCFMLWYLVPLLNQFFVLHALVHSASLEPDLCASYSGS